MDLNVQKSYTLLKFLNHKPSFFGRLFYAVSTAFLVLLLTSRIILSREIFYQIYFNCDLLLGLRRCAWYLKRSRLKINVSDDHLFDFTTGLNELQLNAIESFLKSRVSSLSDYDYISDALCISARRVNLRPKSFNLNEYYALANKILTLPKNNNVSSAAGTKQRVDRKPDFDIASASQALKDFCELFPINETRWFIVSGTFLGLIREGNFLLHDYDIDLGVFDSDVKYTDFLRKIETSSCFSIKKIDKKQIQGLSQTEVPLLIKILHKSGVHIDLFVHYEEVRGQKTIIWHGSSLHRWDNSKFQLHRYNFNEIMVLGPADSEKYLTENYGEWRKEVKDFSSAADTPNFSICFEPVPISIILRRVCLLKKIRQTEVDALIERLCIVGLISQTSTGHVINQVLIQDC